MLLNPNESSSSPTRSILLPLRSLQEVTDSLWTEIETCKREPFAEIESLIIVDIPSESAFPFSLEILIATAIIFIIIISSAKFLTIAADERKRNKEILTKQALVDIWKVPSKMAKITSSQEAKELLKELLKIPAVSEYFKQQFSGILEEFTPASKSEKEEKTNIVETITGIGGLVISVLGVGLIPLIAFPLLDYSAYTQIAANEANLIINVKNIGFTSAKNLIVTVHADNANFSNFVSEPYLPEQFKKNVSSPGEAYGKLTVLPPRADIKFIAEINTSSANNNVVLTPYILSEETVGKINRLWTLIFYSLLAAIYSTAFIYFYFRVNLKRLKIHHVLLTVLLLAIYAVGFYIIYDLFAFSPTYPESRLL
jgi:hypothetical protein